MREILRWSGKLADNVPTEYLSFSVICFADDPNIFRYVTYI